MSSYDSIVFIVVTMTILYQKSKHFLKEKIGTIFSFGCYDSYKKKRVSRNTFYNI